MTVTVMARMTNEDEDEDRRALWHGRWPRPSLSRSKPEDRTEALQPRVKAERRHTYTPTRRHEPCRSASATPCRGAHRTLHTAPRSTSTAQRWDDAMTSRSGWRATYTYIALGGRLGGKGCHWGNGRGLLDYRIGFDIGDMDMGNSMDGDGYDASTSGSCPSSHFPGLRT